MNKKRNVLTSTFSISRSGRGNMGCGRKPDGGVEGGRKSALWRRGSSGATSEVESREAGNSRHTSQVRKRCIFILKKRYIPGFSYNEK